jgi:hypothetical protein
MTGKLATAHAARLTARELRGHPVTAKNQSTVFTKYIGKLKVGPSEQARLSLGFFGENRPEKGFSIAISPDPAPLDSVITEMLSIGSPTRYELFLTIANYGTKAVNTEVWRM